MTATTLTTALDMSDPENVKDALWQLDRAHDDREMARWASRYGRALAEYCRDNPALDGDDPDLIEAQTAATDAEDESARLKRVIENALDMADKIDGHPDYDPIISYLSEHTS